MSNKHRQRPAVTGALAALLLGSATGALAQEQTDPPPPQPDTTTVEEPIAEADAPPAEPPAEEPAPKEPKHVPPDASGIDLSTLETKQLLAALFRPGPDLSDALHRAGVRECARFPQAQVQLDAVGPDHGAAQGLRRLWQRRRALDARTMRCCSTSRRCRSTMETFTPGERFFTMTNHELAHVATMDVWNKRDAFWRRLPARQADADPGASGIDPLQLPRDAAEQCAALVPRRRRRSSSKPGWRAGLAAARAAMTRWCSAPRSATATNSIRRSAWKAEGTAIDFQVGVNDYLYGTRFMS